MIVSVIDTEICDSSVKWRLTSACNFRCSYCIRNNLHLVEDISKIENDFWTCYYACPEVNRIIEELPGKTCKLNLIGGELSLMDIRSILSRIPSKKITYVNIVSNCSGKFSWYKDLAEYLKSRNIVFELTLSWHTEFMSFNDYSKKVLDFQKLGIISLKCELVLRQNIEKEHQQFKAFCEENNIDYLIDVDLFSFDEEKRKGLKGEGKRYKPRYKLVHDDGNITYCETSNQLLTGTEQTYTRSAFVTEGWYCYRDCDYVYLEKNIHMGRLGDNPGCKNYEPIENFHPYKKPKQCQQHCCTLCGRISISKQPIPEIEEKIKK